MKQLLQKVVLCCSASALSVSAFAANTGCHAPSASAPLMLGGCQIGDSLVLRGVNFATDEAVILPASLPLLEQVAAELASNPTIQVEIQGHTDSIGPDSYNQALSQSRAAAVQSFLLARGVHPEQIRSQGFGEAIPLKPNDTEAGRAENRRVELAMVGTREIRPAEPPPPQDVYITTFSAHPSSLTVPVGTTVTWHNYSEQSHNVTFADESLGRIWTEGTSALPWGGGTVSRTFDKPGTYAYRCTVTNSVKGTIVVEAVDKIVKHESPAFPGHTTVNIGDAVTTTPYDGGMSHTTPKGVDHGASATRKSPVVGSSAAPAVVASAPAASAPSAMKAGSKAGGAVVTIEGRAFHPEHLTVPVGTTVTWSHQGSSIHKIRMGGKDGDAMSSGGTYSQVFNVAGEYPYQCGIHSSMKGTITVLDT